MATNDTKPSGLPVPNSTVPFWRTQLHEIDEHRSTEDIPSECDVLIIGAGYCGASTAYHLINDNPSPPSIVILEARQACSGATARNGGHLRPDPISQSALKNHGFDAAFEIALFEMSHLQVIKDLVEKEKIDCDLAFTEAWDVICGQQNEELSLTFQKLCLTLKETGLDLYKDIEYTHGSKAPEVCGIKDAIGCFKYPAAHIWPYKFVTSLLALEVAKGVNLQTNTPVTAVSSAPDSNGFWTATTPRGSIRAKKVVLSTNGYTSALLPQYSGVIVPNKGICSYINVPSTWEGPRFLESVCLTPGNGWDYLIARTDGSFIVGGGYSSFYKDRKKLCENRVDDDTLIEPAAHYFDDYMQRTFTGWEDSGASVGKIWTGISGYTSDDFPHVGAVPGKPGQFIAAGFNGHGMPVIFLTGKGIAEMVLGKTFEESGVPKIFKTTEARLEKA